MLETLRTEDGRLSNFNPLSKVNELSSRIGRAGKSALKPAARGAAKRALPFVERAAGSPSAGAAKDANREGKKRVKGTASAYNSLARALPGATSAATDGWEAAPPSAEVKHKVKTIKRLQAESAIIEHLVNGDDLALGIVETTRNLLKNGHINRVVSLGYSLRSRPETRDLGSVVLGMTFLRTSGEVNAWKAFSGVSNTSVAQPAAAEFYSAAFGAIGGAAAPILRTDIDSGQIRTWKSNAVLHVAQYAFTQDLYALTSEIIDHGLDRSDEETSQRVREELKRLQTWLPEGRHRTLIPAGNGAANFGVVSYEQPGTRSRNIGDYIQTVASIGHLVRQQNLEFAGDSELVEIFDDFRGNLKSDRALTDATGKLHLLELYRDGNVYQDLPENTWAVTFGWYMHDTFGKVFNIPFHPNLRPIMISVFIRHPEMLTPEAIEYLKEYGPIGCRDWQSVALLRAVGVPAFFSGCITTTVDTVFSDTASNGAAKGGTVSSGAVSHDEGTPGSRTDTLRVDWPEGGGGASRTQSLTAIRDKSFADNLRLARDWVADYRYTYAKVLTSRLHAYLPARSVGAEVTFRPKNKSDSRFGGLIDIDDDAFDTIRNGILDKLGTLLPMIAAAEPAERIYAEWDRLTEPDIRAADEYLAAAELPQMPTSTVQQLIDAFDVADPDSESGTDIFVDVRGNESSLLSGLAQSIDDHTTQIYRLWVIADAVETEMVDELNGQLAHGTVHVVTVSIKDLTAAAPALSGIEPTQILLALLPEIFPSLKDIILLPAASRVNEDITTISKFGVAADHVLAAKDDQRRNHASGLTLLRSFASRLGDEHQKALQFTFASHNQLTKDFRPFDPQVMRLDLEKLRSDDYSARLLGLMSSIRLDFGEALQVLVGDNRSPLPAEWNTQPGYELQESPALVNWRETARPGGTEFVPLHQ